MKNNTLAIALASLLVGGVAVAAFQNGREDSSLAIEDGGALSRPTRDGNAARQELLRRQREQQRPRIEPERRVMAPPQPQRGHLDAAHHDERGRLTGRLSLSGRLIASVRLRGIDRILASSLGQIIWNVP